MDNFKTLDAYIDFLIKEFKNLEKFNKDNPKKATPFALSQGKQYNQMLQAEKDFLLTGGEGGNSLWVIREEARKKLASKGITLILTPLNISIKQRNGLEIRTFVH